jgi:hypothetical protein
VRAYRLFTHRTFSIVKPAGRYRLLDSVGVSLLASTGSGTIEACVRQRSYASAKTQDITNVSDCGVVEERLYSH